MGCALSAASFALDTQRGPDATVSGTNRSATTVAAKMGAAAATGAAVTPGEDRIIQQKTVERRRQNFKWRAMVAQINPDRDPQNETHRRGLQHSLYHPTGHVAREINCGRSEWPPGILVPRNREIVLDDVHAERKHQQQPHVHPPPEKKSGQDRNAEDGGDVVKENVVIPVEGFVAAEKREAVEVRSGAGERDGRALTAAELSPVSRCGKSAAADDGCSVAQPVRLFSVCSCSLESEREIFFSPPTAFAG